MATVQLLEGKGECAFDLSLDGPQLRPAFFGSRFNQPFEIHYHSFIGEVTCGRWTISCCRRYLWGKKCYWICDCIAVKEILEYTGSIHQLRRWPQELLRYEFTIILIQASCMHLADRTTRPFSYSFDSFVVCSNPRRVTTFDTTISTAVSSPLPTFNYSSLSTSLYFPIYYPIIFRSKIYCK